MKSKIAKIPFFISGSLVVVITLFLIISIATFNPLDPSILHISSNKISNWGGSLGANCADLILQSIGYCFIFIIPFLSVFAFRLFQGNFPYYFFLRLGILLIALPLTCGAANTIAEFFAYNKIAYGGFIGDFIITELSQIIRDKKLLSALLISFSTVCLLLFLGLRLTEWKNIFISIFRAICRLSLLFLNIFNFLIKKVSKKKELLIDNNVGDNLEIDKPIKNNLLNKIPIKTKSSKNIDQSAQSDHKINSVKKTLEKNSSGFLLPPTTLLTDPPNNNKSQFNKDTLLEYGAQLSQVLVDFGVNAKLLEVSPGPVVTLYEFEPAAGTKSSRVIGLADDIARSMRAISARISVIPGKNAIGIELPNPKREVVYLREILESNLYQENSLELPLILGKNISGNHVIADLARMPHLLVAGTTGSGKSVAINTMIISLLYRYAPEECKFVMIDPKMLELSVYEGIPHLLSPVVTEPKKAVAALKWVVKEMEERYKAMSTLGVRNIAGYNTIMLEAISSGKVLTKNIQTGFDRATGKPIFETISMESKKLPYIVVIVDEMADLMLVAGKDIESYIQRLAQMARAAGIHIIMATQRPSVDVITGVIKANFPTRISFQVTSKIDSRTILGEQGAEQLLGMGDMLYMKPGGQIERVHGPFVNDKEVEGIVQFWKSQAEPVYIGDITLEEEEDNNESIPDFYNENNGDNLYKQAVEIVIRDRKPSTSYVQRVLRIGYNRAANIIEKMEKEGLITAPNHSGKREIID